ncbi:MAG: hypothetical protein PPHEMADM_4081 [uncultured Paraburkholderia sp.]|nr:MAG: hypothetical protein PPHEMADE_4038 [uncultured Paraburkholderia sp.]CAH2936262.1 MAG: hypothetical protein PPHEMADM_4081 [uncultured Paraburkholderia sp.]
MTLRLHELGVFKWAEWTECLEQTIREAQVAGELDYRDTYYYHWLAALERISAKKGLVTDRSLAQRQNEWDIAARNTPHGQPIEIKR